MEYNVVALGGTFDQFHVGHKKIIEFAFSKGEKVVIGVTTDAFVKSEKNNQVFWSYDERRKAVEAYLKEKLLISRSIIIPLNDIYGPARGTDYNIEALIVTEDTKQNADIINNKRVESNLMPLGVIVMELAKSDNIIISSSFVRGKVMDQEGNLLIPKNFYKSEHRLPSEKRLAFQEPFSILHETIMPAHLQALPANKIVTVGDVTTKKFHDLGIFPKIAVIDFLVQRKKMFDSLSELGFVGSEEILLVENHAGTIEKETWKALFSLIRKIPTKSNFIVQVSGEEDLLTIPLILLLPINFRVFYGQPNQGINEVIVDNQAKEKAQRLLNLLA